MFMNKLEHENLHMIWDDTCGQSVDLMVKVRQCHSDIVMRFCPGKMCWQWSLSDELERTPRNVAPVQEERAKHMSHHSGQWST